MDVLAVVAYTDEAGHVRKGKGACAEKILAELECSMFL